MKNLAQLKLNAHRFKWSMLSNSWFESVPEFLSDFRTVACVQSQKIGFNTIKNGQATISYTYFPKAKNLEIVALENGDYHVTFKNDCTLSYLLKPIS